MDIPVLEPLKSSAARLPDELFDVVVRIVGSAPPNSGRPDIAAYYDRLLADTLTTRTALGVLFSAGTFGESGAKTDKESLKPSAAKPLAPFVRLQLLGRHIDGVVRAIPAGVVCEFSGHPVQMAQRIGFDPRKLAARAIAEPLATKVYAAPDDCFDVIVEFETHDIPDTAEARRNVIASLEILRERAPDVVSYRDSAHNGHPYVFATMSGEAVVALVELDRNPATAPPAIFRIWEDTAVMPLISVSVATVKADAAHIAYSALGKHIVWAVLDSGIDQTHPHFRHYKNLLTLPPQVKHRDYTRDVTTKDAAGNDASALVDEFGHGTHVAGIIAGALGTDAPFTEKDGMTPVAVTSVRNESGSFTTTLLTFDDTILTGMAPACTLVSYRVLDEKGLGKASSIIEAVTDIRLLNSAANNPIVHGVNLSVGYPFDAEWFACGQSPLCVEIDRLVKSGVVVVAAAGNSGYGVVSTSFTGMRAEGIAMSINDPGNAELAITVGSVHREEPHTYGMSYFSSKGPTGDGRLKPDVVAPGERIISCASSQARSALTVVDASGASKEISAADYTYKEDSGTSMAAPHVSGVIAGFLSIRREFIGQPEEVKRLFMENATDLKRDRNYQGKGLVDPMRVISSI